MTESGPHQYFTDKANPESTEEALQRAAVHARRAGAEALEAVRALLDAASLGLTGQTAEKHAAFAMASQFLADLSDRIAVKGNGYCTADSRCPRSRDLALGSPLKG